MSPRRRYLVTSLRDTIPCASGPTYWYVPRHGRASTRQVRPQRVRTDASVTKTDRHGHGLDVSVAMRHTSHVCTSTCRGIISADTYRGIVSGTSPRRRCRNVFAVVYLQQYICLRRDVPRHRLRGDMQRCISVEICRRRYMAASPAIYRRRYTVACTA